MSESTSRQGPPRRHLGLTGGIGAGKSTVAAMLVELGAHLIDADQISRDLMRPGSPVLAQVVEAFGPEILTENGELDRPALARKVFGDDAARERLNGIVHPAVRREAQAQREAALAAGTDTAGEPAGPDGTGTPPAGGERGVVVVEDIPLLAETGQAERFDGVIVVEAAPEVRLERLVTARGMEREDAEARLRAQASDEQRREIATWVVDNSGDLEQTREQVRKIWAELG